MIADIGVRNITSFTKPLRLYSKIVTYGESGDIEMWCWASWLEESRYRQFEPAAFTSSLQLIIDGLKTQLRIL